MKTSSSASFTLVEMLAAMTVLALVVLLVAQTVGTTTRVVGTSLRHMDALTQANQALDRLDADLRRAARRPDLLPYAAIRAGNDEIRFYSAVPAYAGTRNLSVVAYRIGADATGPILQRGTAGFAWDAAAPGPLPFSTNSDASAVPIADADFQALAPAVFRMEVAFVDRATGAYKAAPASPDWSDVGGLLVTLAALDPKSRLPLGAAQAAPVRALGGMLGDFAAPVPVCAAWEQAAAARPPASGMPPSVQAQLHVVQRLYEW